ncbi:putative quinol monooxygenase [Acinetobacter rathckeae]|uniref:putative quinol monooxygenase n=1 Tax=Acinetobacter rathckeae TaxID=2605272 RepID=UPI0018A27CEF|nr:antibiotic biosynthesis monooxygenase [Acinetobacter rathckeae]MBF7688087.1 antibiotic biosynthesis monooxygenase [Acinetobacter rathckeae]MBF7695401.1 antibiotic biosynthesis monooxygenase [Acinetobacter rathckeae]
MSSVNILATIRFPIEQETEAKEKLIAMLEPSRAEVGNVTYSLFQDQTEQACFIFQEVWHSAEAFTAHQKTAHFIELLGYLKDNAQSVDIQQLSRLDL